MTVVKSEEVQREDSWKAGRLTRQCRSRHLTFESSPSGKVQLGSNDGNGRSTTAGGSRLHLRRLGLRFGAALTEGIICSPLFNGPLWQWIIVRTFLNNNFNSQPILESRTSYKAIFSTLHTTFVLLSIMRPEDVEPPVPP